MTASSLELHKFLAAPSLEESYTGLEKSYTAGNKFSKVTTTRVYVSIDYLLHLKEKVWYPVNT